MTDATRDRMCDAAMRKLTELDFSASRREVWLIVDAVLAEMERPGEGVMVIGGHNLIACVHDDCPDGVEHTWKAMIRAIREGK